MDGKDEQNVLGAQGAAEVDAASPIAAAIAPHDDPLKVLRGFLGPAHPYDDEAGEGYCDYCNLRTPDHRDSCRWQKAKRALDSIEAAFKQGEAVMIAPD